MKSAVLSVIFLTVLFVSTAASAQRGLNSGPSGDQPSAPSDTRVAQQQGASLDPGELFRDCDNLTPACGRAAAGFRDGSE